MDRWWNARDREMVVVFHVWIVVFPSCVQIVREHLSSVLKSDGTEADCSVVCMILRERR